MTTSGKALADSSMRGMDIAFLPSSLSARVKLFRGNDRDQFHVRAQLFRHGELAFGFGAKRGSHRRGVPGREHTDNERQDLKIAPPQPTCDALGVPAWPQLDHDLAMLPFRRHPPVHFTSSLPTSLPKHPGAASPPRHQIAFSVARPYSGGLSRPTEPETPDIPRGSAKSCLPSVSSVDTALILV